VVGSQLTLAFARTGNSNLVFTAVSYPSILEDLKFKSKSNRGISGVFDVWPCASLAKFASEKIPRGSRLGIMFDPNYIPKNCVEDVREQIESLEYQLITLSISDDCDAKTILKKGFEDIDALLIVPSGIGLSWIDKIVFQANNSGIPIVGGDEITVKKGALGTMVASYYKMGRETGYIVAEFLRGNITAQPVISKAYGPLLRKDSASLEQ
jgi:ABC-type uncharacterized transport system substrate-binding protein